jgi:molybdenum cofactor biosynthesis protein MoaC
MQLPPNSEELPQHEKVLLEAVWENGITESSPLPASAEAVRQKYDMAGPEYDYYWQLAAGSLLKVLHVNAKARRKLRAIEQEKLSDGSIIPKTADHEPSSHKTLMNQVRQIWKEERRTKEMGMKFDGQQNVKDNPLAFQNSNRYQARDVSSSIKSRNQNMEAIHSLEDSRDVEKGSQDSQDISQVVEDLLADMDRHVPKIAYSEIFGANDMDRNAPRFSKSDSFEVDVQPLEHVAKGTKTLRFGSRTQEPEQRDKPVNKTFRIGSRAKEPEQQDASKVQKAERTKKLRELSQLRLDLQKKKQELSDRLRAEEEAQILAKKRRDEAPYLERIAKEASSELIDILDVAIEKNVEKTVPTKDQTLALPFNRSRTAHPAARSPKLASTEVHTLPTPSQSLISGSQPAQEVQEQPSDATIEIVLDRAPSDDLRLSVPASGEIPIDSSLTLTLNSDTTTLQSQVLAMQSRLSASYPRIDTLPYNIAESKNTQTLQTWLKILASRWQSRFDKVEDTAQMDPQVKAVLDQMVRDHDLSNPAAKRMAEKWGEIFKRRAALTRDTDDILDDEEFEAGGMSFLRVDEAEVEGMTDSSERVEDDSMSVVTQAVEPSRTEITPEEHEAIIVEESTDDKPFAADHFDTEGSERSEQLKPKTIPLIEPTKTSSAFNSLTRRLYSTSSRPPLDPSLAPKPEQPQSPTPQPTSPSALPHLTPSGSAHMVSVSSKAHTVRTAIAVGTVYFSNSTPLSLIQSNSLKKGDVLSVSRIAGIMAAKKCPDLIPLCHPIALTHVGVELRVFSPETNAEQEKADANDMGFGGVAIEAKVACTGPTGVEMEALTSVMGTALSVVDMCKAVDKFMRVQDVRVVLKEGGKSGVWREKGWRSWQE